MKFFSLILRTFVFFSAFCILSIFFYVISMNIAKINSYLFEIVFVWLDKCNFEFFGSSILTGLILFSFLIIFFILIFIMIIYKIYMMLFTKFNNCKFFCNFKNLYSLKIYKFLIFCLVVFTFYFIFVWSEISLKSCLGLYTVSEIFIKDTNGDVVLSKKFIDYVLSHYYVEGEVKFTLFMERNGDFVNKILPLDKNNLFTNLFKYSVVLIIFISISVFFLIYNLICLIIKTKQEKSNLKRFSFLIIILFYIILVIFFVLVGIHVGYKLFVGDFNEIAPLFYKLTSFNTKAGTIYCTKERDFIFTYCLDKMGYISNSYFSGRMTSLTLMRYCANVHQSNFEMIYSLIMALLNIIVLGNILCTLFPYMVSFDLSTMLEAMDASLAEAVNPVYNSIFEFFSDKGFNSRYDFFINIFPFVIKLADNYVFFSTFDVCPSPTDFNDNEIVDGYLEENIKVIVDCITKNFKIVKDFIKKIFNNFL